MTRRNILTILLSSAGASLLPRRATAFFPSDTEPPEFQGVAKMIRARKLDELEIGDSVVECGKLFLDTPYVGGTLEINANEQCVINFNGLDCVTFFELSLDLARITKSHTLTYASLVNEVTHTRYRSGMISDYSSRLHYTCDWMDDNERKGVVRNMTAALGGVAYIKQINFMSTNPDKYKQLHADPSLVAAIKSMEHDIASRPLFYIPKDQVASIEPRLQNGDIIGITTTITGIDCSHTGIIVKKADAAHFMHASSVKGKVIIANGTLSEYLNSVSRHTGIMVVRPV